MVELMKAQLRKIARTMAGWPVIGRFVRISVAVIRLPEREHIFETQQLPMLRQTLSDLDNLVRSLPVALRKTTRDLVDIREQLESVSNSVDYLSGRVEFVRSELMFEMRYGASTPSGECDQLKAKTEILSSEKLAAARNERLRLNLGCGHVPLEGYLNVDRRALPGVDIVAEINRLPFEQGEVDEIFSAHLLEHFPQEQLRRDLLPYWISLLKKGGEFRAVVPDAESMLKGYVNGDYPYSSLREVTFGAQDYDGDFHFNMFIPDQLTLLLKEVGFSDTELIYQGRRNGACFEMEIRAFK
jgi:hypothetical protein